MRWLIICCIVVCVILKGNGQRVIEFSGYKWNVRSGGGGPGPNSWSDAVSSVWVDSSGYLHLTINKSGETWYCSEVYLQSSLGYGEYTFELLSDPEVYDPLIVAGLFTYENDSREIDIEFAKWGNEQGLTSWYTVQPAPYTLENHQGFQMGLNGRTSTHRFMWSMDSICFTSTTPHMLTLPPSDSILAQWTYKGSSNPPPGNERLHLNFWLFQGQPPSNGQPAELIIRSLSFRQPNSIPDPDNVKPYRLFPNPLKNRLSITFSKPVSLVEVSVYSSDGKLIIKEARAGDEVNIDLQGVGPGICLLRIESSGVRWSEKIIILP